MTTSIETVAVGGASIEAIERDGDVWISLRRVCEALEIDPDSQRVKLLQKPWARTEIIAVRDPAGRTQPTFMVALQSLPMWLATIDHTRVVDTVVKRLIAFQTEAHDALAAHFFGSSRTVMSTARPSGGAAGSGGSPTAATSAVVGSGSALQMLQMFDALSGAMRASITEVAEVRALVDSNRTELQAELAEARKQTAAAVAVADRAVANSTFAREDRRRCDAAVAVITRAVKSFAASRGDSYQDLYSRLRRELGLRPSSQGGKTLGKSKLSASQVLVLSDAASRMGVAGVGAARIRAILDGVEIVPVEPAQAPRVITPRADDVVIGGES